MLISTFPSPIPVPNASMINRGTPYNSPYAQEGQTNAEHTDPSSHTEQPEDYSQPPPPPHTHSPTQSFTTSLPPLPYLPLPIMTRPPQQATPPPHTQPPPPPPPPPPPLPPSCPGRLNKPHPRPTLSPSTPTATTLPSSTP